MEISRRAFLGSAGALALGGCQTAVKAPEYAFKWITTGKFLRMAKTIGLGDRVMRRELDKMERRVSRVLPRMVKAAQKRWPSFCYGEIAAGINKRIAQLNGKQKD